MATLKVLARNWTIEVNTGTADVPAWTKVGGINTFTLTNGKEDADTTDFDSDGFSEHLPASRSTEISFEGFFLEDPADGTRDAGQAEIERLGGLVGPEAMASTRITSPSGTAKIYTGSYNTGDVGGGNNDPTSWGATLTVSGKPQDVA